MDNKILKENRSSRIDEICDLFNSDSVHLRQILPEELWKLIAEKLLKDSPSDSERLTNSSPYFRKLLIRKTPNTHFEKVFPLMAFSIWEHSGLEGFTLSEIFKCRQVSPKWNTAIDKLIPQKFQHLGQKPSNNFLRRIGLHFEHFLEEHNWFTNSLTWNTEKTVENFLLHFSQSHLPPSIRNPLIWDNLSIKICFDLEDTVEDYLRYLENITLLLSKYGHHIQTFSLDIDKHNFLHEGLRLQEWFALMPNLKVLTFESDCWEELEPDMEYYEEDYSFKKLDNLESLEIKALPPPLIRQLIRHNSQISKLIVSFWYEHYDFHYEDLPNLKCLEIEFDSRAITHKLEYVRWPVETLKVSVEHLEENEDDIFWGRYVRFDSLLEVIEDRFGSTLVNLELNWCEDNERAIHWVNEECRNGRLELPNLKRIELSLGGVLVCLDFLIGMKDNLEEVSVHVGYKYPVEEKDIETSSGNIVEFVGFEERMLEGNVWGIFEKLWKFEVWAVWAGMTYRQKKTYSRKDL